MKITTKETFFGEKRRQKGSGWAPPSENMRKLDRNIKEVLSPFLSDEADGYEIELFLSHEHLLRELPISDSKYWSTDYSRKNGVHGGLGKLFHNSDPKHFLIVQVFHQFRDINKLYSSDYPHINTPGAMVDQWEKETVPSHVAKEVVKAAYSAVPQGSIFYLCNTGRCFFFGRYTDIIALMEWRSRNKIRKDGSYRWNRLIFPSKLMKVGDVKYGYDFIDQLEYYLPKR